MIAFALDAKFSLELTGTDKAGNPVDTSSFVPEDCKFKMCIRDRFGIMPVCGRDALCIRDFFEALAQTLTGWDGLEVMALFMPGGGASADERLDSVCGCAAKGSAIRRLCLIPDWEAFCACLLYTSRCV